MISKFDPNIPGQESRLQSEPMRENFNALNDRTDQLTPSATSPVSTSVLVSSADKIYFEDNTYVPFSGGSINLGSTSTGVTAFNVPENFKEIVIYYENDSGTGKLGFVESFEKTTPLRDTQDLINDEGNQVDPTTGSPTVVGNLLEGKIIICSILVQNSGSTGQRGQIVQIGDADILDLRPYMQRGGGLQALVDHINAPSLAQAHPGAAIGNSIISVVSSTLASSTSIGAKQIFLPTEAETDFFTVGDFIRIPTTAVSVTTVDASTEFVTAQVIQKNTSLKRLTLDRPLPVAFPAGRVVIRGTLTLDRMAFDIAQELEDVTSGSFLSISLDTNSEVVYRLGLNQVLDENVDAAAAIQGTKIDPDFGSQNIVTTGTLLIDNVTNSTSVTTGAIVTDGGVGIGLDLRVGDDLFVTGDTDLGGIVDIAGRVRVNDTSNATSTTTGSLQTDGGLGVVLNSHLGGTLNVTGATSLSSTLNVTGIVSANDTTQSTSTTTGALKTLGGLGVVKNAFIGGNLDVAGTADVDLLATFNAGVNVSGILDVLNTTQSTSTSTGAITTDGGLGVALNAYVGGLANIGTSLVTGTSITAGSSLSVTTSASVGTTLGVGSTLTVTGIATLNDATNSTTKDNGALVVANGGVGIEQDLSVGGIIRAGTGPTVLTDSAGKILSVALNTIQVAQGGTGSTSFNTPAGTDSRLPTVSGTSAFGDIRATDASVASTIVKRDASGGFSAGAIDAVTIDADLTGAGASVAGVAASTVGTRISGATATNTATTLVLRDATGAATFTLSSAQIWVGNSSNVSTPRTMTGDATLSNTGVLSLAAGSVDTAELVDSSVTTNKIDNLAVTTGKIGSQAVTTAKIADGDVTNVKLASGIDASKVTTGTLPFGVLPIVTGSATIGGGGSVVVPLTDANKYRIMCTFSSSLSSTAEPLSVTTKGGASFTVTGESSEDFEWVAVRYIV